MTNCGSHGIACNVANATNSCSTSGVCSFTCDSLYTSNGKICCGRKVRANVVVDNSNVCHYECVEGATNEGTSTEPSCRFVATGSCPNSNYTDCNGDGSKCCPKDVACNDPDSNIKCLQSAEY